MQRHPQRVQNERGAHVAGELPADDPAAVGVDDEREEHHAFPASEVGDVGDPEPIRAGGGEVAIDEVRAPARGRIRFGGAPWLAAAFGAADAVGAHQALHGAARDRLARPVKRDPHPPGSVGVVVGLVDLSDPAEQPLVLDGPRERQPVLRW